MPPAPYWAFPRPTIAGPPVPKLCGALPGEPVAFVVFPPVAAVPEPPAVLDPAPPPPALIDVMVNVPDVAVDAPPAVPAAVPPEPAPAIDQPIVCPEWPTTE